MFLPMLLVPLTIDDEGYSVGAQNRRLVPLAVVSTPPASSAAAPVSATVDAGNAQSFVLTEKSFYALYIQLYSAPADYRGDTITLTGRITKTVGMGADTLFAGHELMWCCAADAVPVGFLCRGASLTASAASGWVQLHGTLSTTQWADPYSNVIETVPLVLVTKFESMAAPDFLFVYPGI